jgi:hypothetical protein
MGITLKRFVETYLEDLQWWGKRYYTKEGIAHRQSTKTRGIFTVQYPEAACAENSLYPFLAL